ncbi:AtzE family amidohydrolase [Uliginosibacterium sp. H3]|uniref:AtzE family amidohydrolase n=1 Tax=Uliginosibacterium silvisoli TaxID=3114758 RepID=A0ABU6JXX5_9RHOO|nr:AtzE family amidohydrolase [Uliginosibacterium sp. H3]
MSGVTSSTPLEQLAAWQVADAVASGEVSAHEVVTRVLQSVRSRDANINAYTDLTERRALQEADAIDARRKRGEPMPALAGVPYAVKNLFDVEGLQTLAGGHRGRAGAPVSRDATLVTRAANAGACLIGALNMDAYAYGFTTENSFHGVTRNPHDPLRVAGGSSGGCGAAVAADMCAFSLGSDTNGSIRVPSSFCGVFGLKPTFGGLSRGGSRPFVHNIDHLGPFARSPRDLARVFDVLVGLDERDHGCTRAAPLPGESTTEAAVLRATQEGLGGLRVARLNGYFDHWAGPDARTASRSVAMMFAAQEELDVPNVAAARASGFVITASESGELYRSELQAHYADMEPLNRDRMLAGSLLPATWYVQAQRFRQQFVRQMLALFERFDLLVAPATPCVATEIGQQWLELPGGRVPARPSIGLLTQPISFIGLPVVVAPLPTANGMPIGVQLIAAPGREDVALAAAAVLEAGGYTYTPKRSQRDELDRHEH